MASNPSASTTAAVAAKPKFTKAFVKTPAVASTKTWKQKSDKEKKNEVVDMPLPGEDEWVDEEEDEMDWVKVSSEIEEDEEWEKVEKVEKVEEK